MAIELQSSLIGSSTYNSNVYGSNGDERSDVIYQGGVLFELRDTASDRLDYLLSYRGDYEAYTDETEANAMEHRQRFRLRYDIDSRTRATFNQRYRRVSNLQFDRDDFEFDDVGVDISQNKYERIDLSLGLEREISRRWQIETLLEFQDVDFNRNLNRSDSSFLSISATARQQLSDQQSWFLGVKQTEQDFDHAPTRLGAESSYTSISLGWDANLTNHLSLSIYGGPVWVDTTQDRAVSTSASSLVTRLRNEQLFGVSFSACAPDAGQNQPIASNCSFTNPGFPPVLVDSAGMQSTFPLNLSDIDLKSDDTEFFGGIEASFSYPSWEWRLAYLRRQSATSGESLATRLDEVRFDVEYTAPQSRWSTYFQLRFDQRKSITDAVAIDNIVIADGDGLAIRSTAFGNEVGIESGREAYAVLLGGSYQFSSQLSASVESRARRGDQPRGSFSSDKTNRYFFAVSVRYDFRPQRF